MFPFSFCVKTETYWDRDISRTTVMSLVGHWDKLQRHSFICYQQSFGGGGGTSWQYHLCNCTQTSLALESEELNVWWHGRYGSTSCDISCSQWIHTWAHRHTGSETTKDALSVLKALKRQPTRRDVHSCSERPSLQLLTDVEGLSSWREREGLLEFLVTEDLITLVDPMLLPPMETAKEHLLSMARVVPCLEAPLHQRWQKI